MTKTYIEYQSVQTRLEIAGITCDWCGCDIPLRKGFNHYTETEISVVEVHPSDDGAGGHGWSVEDLCQQCGEKLRTLVEQAGIKVTEIDF